MSSFWNLNDHGKQGFERLWVQAKTLALITLVFIACRGCVNSSEEYRHEYCRENWHSYATDTVDEYADFRAAENDTLKPRSPDDGKQLQQLFKED